MEFYLRPRWRRKKKKELKWVKMKKDNYLMKAVQSMIDILLCNKLSQKIYYYFEAKYLKNYTPKKGDIIIDEDLNTLKIERKGEILKVNKMTGRFEDFKFVLPSSLSIYNLNKKSMIIDSKENTTKQCLRRR